MSTKAKGTVFGYGDTADYATATTWTKVANVKTIKLPNMSCDEIDATTLDDDTKRKLAGLGDYGDAEITVEYDKTQTGALAALLGTDKSFRVKYPSNSGWVLNGFIKEIGDDEVKNGELIQTTLKVAVNKLEHKATFTVTP